MTNGDNSEVLNQIIEQFQVKLRNIDYTGVTSSLEEINRILRGNLLPPKFAKTVSSLVLPILYPSESHSSKLRFSIQCLAATYLLRWSPSTRIQILGSIISIFEQYPTLFYGNSAIKRLSLDHFEISKNLWEQIEFHMSSFVPNTMWCFLLYIFDNIEIEKNACWSVINKLVGDSSTFNSSNSHKIITFLSRTSKIWSSNPEFSFLFLNSMLKNYQYEFSLSLPDFLISASEPNTLNDKVIFIISSHLTEVSPQTARVLSTIMQNETRIGDKVFFISLVLSLIKFVPKNYTGLLYQKAMTYIKNFEFEPLAASQIVAFSSIIGQSQNSIVDIFCSKFMINSNLLSIFYGHLSDLVDHLESSSLILLLNDSVSVVKSNGCHFGICQFISKVLNKMSKNIEPFKEDRHKFSQIIDIFVSMKEYPASYMAAKIVAKLLPLSNRNQTITIDFSSVQKIQFTCGVCCYSLCYCGSQFYSIDQAISVYFVSKLLLYEKYVSILAKNSLSSYNISQFPPQECQIDDIIANNLLEISKNNISKHNIEEFYSIIIEIIRRVSSSTIICKFIIAFWVNADNTPIFTFIQIIEIISTKKITYQNVFGYVLSLIYSQNNEVISLFKNCFMNYQFRSWVFNHVFYPISFRNPQPFLMAEKLGINLFEFKTLLPAMKYWLSYQNNSNVNRAAAIRLVSAYPTYIPLLTQHTISVSKALLFKSDVPLFPDLGDDDCDPISPNINFYIPPIENKNAISHEFQSSLIMLSRMNRIKESYLTDDELDTLYQTLHQSNDPRVRKPYMKLLVAIGLRGAPYACHLLKKELTSPCF